MTYRWPAIRWPAILVALAACFAVACQKAETREKSLTPVKTKPVELYSVAEELRYSASVEPDTQVTTAFKVGGYVEKLAQVRGVDGHDRDIQEGDTVTAGMTLASIRSNDYTVRVDQAASQVAEAKFSLASAKSQLAEAETGMRQAQLDFDRAKNLFETQSITKAEYDGAKSKLDAAQARVESARGQVEAIQARIGGAQARVAESNIALGDTELKAPIAGVVLKRMIRAGTVAAAGTPAFVIADTRVVKVVFGVPDTMVSRIRPGMALPIRTEAIPDAEFSGRVTNISPAADPKSRVFDVEISVSNSSNRLKTGMIASVMLTQSNRQRQVPVLPLSAVTRSKTQPESYAVFIVQNEGGKQVARMRDVQLGQAFGNAIAVMSGVQVGQQVITNGTNLVTEGEPVQVVP